MNLLKKKSPESTFYFSGFILISLSLFLSTLQARGVLQISQLLPSCFFYFLTHLPCPGCGMTRAIQALFSFHLIDSFLYHPVVLYCAAFYAFYMISYTLSMFSNHFEKRKLHIAYVYAGLILMLVQWVAKLIYIVLSAMN